MAIKQRLVKPISKKEMSGYVSGEIAVDFIETMFETFVEHGIIKRKTNKKGDVLYSGDCIRRILNTMILHQNKKVK
jgi:hypothetical protein